jgi:hypothetical protein
MSELDKIKARDARYCARVGIGRAKAEPSNANQAARDRHYLLHVIDLQEAALKVFREGKPTKPCHPEHMDPVADLMPRAPQKRKCQNCGHLTSDHTQVEFCNEGVPVSDYICPNPAKPGYPTKAYLKQLGVK